MAHKHDNLGLHRSPKVPQDAVPGLRRAGAKQVCTWIMWRLPCGSCGILEGIGVP